MKKTEQKTKYRNEWKFFCSNFRLEAVEMRLKAALTPDKHSDINAKYIVNTIYFDDYNDTCFHDVEAGNPERFKFRIRYYNNDLSTLKLERKEKLYGYCRKFCTNITKEEAKDIIECKFHKLFWQTKNKLLQRCLVDLINGNYRPKIITKYERCALEDKVKNIRVTLDRDIKSSLDFNNFLSPDYLCFILNSGNKCVWEIKFDCILPVYIQNLCYSNFMSRQTFSKFYLAIKNMKRIKQWTL